MVPHLLTSPPLSLGFAQTQSRYRCCRIPLWAWILGLFLIAGIVKIIITLREKEKITWKGDDIQPPPPPTPEPAKPATETEPVPPPEVEAESLPPAEPPAPRTDNLKRINGIGPKIETMLNENGITTFVQLAETEVSRLQALLVEAGWERLADPATWPEQARQFVEEK